jgi:hypothetical protein
LYKQALLFFNFYLKYIFIFLFKENKVPALINFLLWK